MVSVVATSALYPAGGVHAIAYTHRIKPWYRSLLPSPCTLQVVFYDNGQYYWEPGSNRTIDLSRFRPAALLAGVDAPTLLPAAGVEGVGADASMGAGTGAGGAGAAAVLEEWGGSDSYCTLYWGQPGSTPVLVVPRPAVPLETVEGEVVTDGDDSQTAPGAQGTGSGAQRVTVVVDELFDRSGSAAASAAAAEAESGGSLFRLLSLAMGVGVGLGQDKGAGEAPGGEGWDLQGQEEEDRKLEEEVGLGAGAAAAAALQALRDRSEDVERQLAEAKRQLVEARAKLGAGRAGENGSAQGWEREREELRGTCEKLEGRCSELEARLAAQVEQYAAALQQQLAAQLRSSLAVRERLEGLAAALPEGPATRQLLRIAKDLVRRCGCVGESSHIVCFWTCSQR